MLVSLYWVLVFVLVFVLAYIIIKNLFYPQKDLKDLIVTEIKEKTYRFDAYFHNSSGLWFIKYKEVVVGEGGISEKIEETSKIYIDYHCELKWITIPPRECSLSELAQMILNYKILIEQCRQKSLGIR